MDDAVGKRILDLASPALEADERDFLEAHLAVCAYCRLALDLHAKLGEGIRDGSLNAEAHPMARRVARPNWFGWGAGAAVAAGLILMFALPPRPTGTTLVLRGPDKTRFLRPVEGEVVRKGSLALRWTEVPGADGYRVQVTGLNGGSTWTGTAEEASLVLPGDAIPAGEETYRAILSTVPEDLLPPGSASVSFKTGGLLAVASHQAQRAQLVSYVFALAGLTLAIAAFYRRRSGSLQNNIPQF